MQKCLDVVQKLNLVCINVINFARTAHHTTTYLFTKSDLMEPITPNKLLFGRNLLYRNTDHFDAKTDEISLTKRCKRTSILLTHFWNKS